MSAIARTNAISGGCVFSNNGFLSIDKMFILECPGQKRLVPSWDLSPILEVLQIIS